jgi:CRISPR-associated protein (TIGR02710 family)
MKWLVLTVGSTAATAVTSIARYAPDRVYFVCSGDSAAGPGSHSMVTGKGMVCSSKHGVPPDLPAIPVQAHLTDDQWAFSRYDVEPDDLCDCYRKCVDAFSAIRQSDPQAEVFADYTGGTKSMVVGLAAASIDDGEVELILVTGARKTLDGVTDKTQAASTASVVCIVRRRYIDRAMMLVHSYDYGAAVEVLGELGQKTHDAEISHLYALCCGFDAWDRFDHENALRIIDAADRTGEFGGLRGSLGVIVKAIQRREDDGHTALPLWKTETGFLLAADILRNAERRADDCRWDDAVARHYRACELVAQTALWTMYQIDAGRTRPDQVPESLSWRSAMEPEFALGLRNSWELLAALDAPLGKLWAEWRENLLNAMQYRNYSLLAHGTQPVAKSDYEKDVEHGLAGFTRSALGNLAARKVYPDRLMTGEFPRQFTRT